MICMLILMVSTGCSKMDYDLNPWTTILRGKQMTEKGPNDLEETIDKLKKQVEFLQGKCRQAGSAIIDQEITINGLKKEIDRLSEENSNLSLIKGNKNGKE